MPRLISAALTADAVIERRKTVTRRAGWAWLNPGTNLTIVRKAMGLKKGEQVDRLAEVQVTSVRRELLSAITDEDVLLEGFTPADLDAYTCSEEWPTGELARAFCRFYTSHMGGGIHQEVTRIEWVYL